MHLLCEVDEVSKTSKRGTHIASQPNQSLVIDRGFPRANVKLRDDQQVKNNVHDEACRIDQQRHIRVIQSSSTVSDSHLHRRGQRHYGGDLDIFDRGVSDFRGDKCCSKLVRSSNENHGHDGPKHGLDEYQGVRKAKARGDSPCCSVPNDEPR